MAERWHLITPAQLGFDVLAVGVTTTTGPAVEIAGFRALLWRIGATGGTTGQVFFVPTDPVTGADLGAINIWLSGPTSISAVVLLSMIPGRGVWGDGGSAPALKVTSIVGLWRGKLQIVTTVGGTISAWLYGLE